MPKVALVTDSTASLAPDVCRKHDIRVVPLQVVVAGRAYDAGVDEEATPAFVAQALRDRLPVSTSRPAPAVLLEAYEAAAEAGAEAVVSVHLSSELSATYESALLAARGAPVPVELVDTRQVGMAVGCAVLRANDVLAAGGSATEAAEAARACADGSASLFYVDTLEYLRRGGRVGSTAALLGSVLSVKPLLRVVDGRIATAEKVRTAARGLARLAELAVDAAEERQVEVAVAHLESPDRADELAGVLGVVLAANLEGREVSVLEIDPVIGAHTGPGLVGVCVAPV